MVLGLLRPTMGSITFRGSAVDHPRREVQAVFQNPFEAFNPFYRVDHPLDLVISRFGLAERRSDAKALKEAALRAVQLDPQQTLGRYPHQLSGGQLQRLMMARAILVRPAILVADEPVSMVDASLRVLVLDSMLRLKESHGISQLFITHDLATALQVSDELLVMHEGRVVESGDPLTIIRDPQDPYTRSLVSAIPSGDPRGRWGLRTQRS
jgi:peptide/nickel transport system ATP-binding protein